MSAPKLRFKGFADVWKVKSLNNICELTSSKRVYLSDYVKKGIPFYRGKEISELKANIQPKEILYIKNELYLEFKEKFGVPSKNDILITAVGTLGNLFLIKNDSEFYFKDGNLIWLRKINQNPLFLEILLDYHKSEVKKSAIGSSQKALTMVELKKLKFYFPSIIEQEKIASFFTVIDQKINLLKEKKEKLELYKKGVMQQIFSQKLRFKDEKGNEFPEWEEKTLSETLNSLPTKKHQIKSTEILDFGNHKVIDQGKKDIAGFSDHENTFKDVPVIVFGDHTTILKYVDFPFVVGADGTKLLKNKSEDNLKYIYFNLDYNNVEQEGYKRHFSILSEVILQIPSLPEQKKIADFLSALDTKINLVSTQIEKTELWKNGLLQQMFV